MRHDLALQQNWVNDSKAEYEYQVAENPNSQKLFMHIWKLLFNKSVRPVHIALVLRNQVLQILWNKKEEIVIADIRLSKRRRRSCHCLIHGVEEKPHEFLVIYCQVGAKFVD